MLSSNLHCPLCGDSRLDLVTNKVRFDKQADVYKCRTCALLFLDQGSYSLPDDFYKSEYHQTYLTHVEPAAFDPQAYFSKMTKATRIWADKFSALLTGNEVVLDVGCSTGHFIELIKGRTRKCYGSELNEKEVAFCRQTLKLDVSARPLQERFDKGMFDYITLIFVLEHIAEPKQFLNQLQEYLKPGGKIVIVVPNAMDPLLNLYALPEFKHFYFCAEHLFYYTQDTIKRLFDETHLSGKIDVIQEYPLANHLNWGYRRRSSDTLAARNGLPDIELLDASAQHEWESLWRTFDSSYKGFLDKFQYGDRLWCVAEKK